MKRIVLFFTVIAALVTPFANAAEKPLILSTIKPIHALVSTIAGDTSETVQMIPDFASPHHYSLKPSDLRRLGNAALIFRIDPKMEAQLNKSLSTVDQDKLIVLSQTKGLELLDAGHSHDGNHDEDETNEDHDAHEDEEHDEHDDGEKDYHLWLDPSNALIMSDVIRGILSETFPKHKTTFEKNTNKLKQAIRLADTEISEKLAAVSDQPFLVMHDAWQYFTHHYELNQLGSITQQEGLKPSGKAISNARKLIKNNAVRCIVTEPGVKRRTLAVLTEDFDVNTTEIDPLGRAIPLSDQTYPELLQHTATQLLNCLKPE